MTDIDLDLSTSVLAAVAGTLPARPTANDEPAEIDLLRRRAAAVDATGQAWTELLATALAEPHPRDRRLVGLARALRLTPLEVAVVALAVSVERELMVGRALARLQAPVGGARPCFGLLDYTFGELAGETRVAEVVAAGNALAAGLLVLQDGTAPIPERVVAVPVPTALALGGADVSWPAAAIGQVDARDPLTLSQRDEADHRGRALAGPDALVVRTASVVEGQAACARIAASRGQRPLFLPRDADLVGLGPFLLARDLVPVVLAEPSPGETHDLPELAAFEGPLLCVCGPDGSLARRVGVVHEWRLRAPTVEERVALWRDSLADCTNGHDLSAELGPRRRCGGGEIAELAVRAQHEARLAGRTVVEPADVDTAAWSVSGKGLGSLAQPLRDPVPDEALVVPAELHVELESLRQRCRLREDLVDGLGAAARTRYRPGVRALFSGPPGTGKSLAAGWLATKLGIPLFRVDLASVTSKYIGETEKHLASLFAGAERGDLVLLFDEADAMFGQRTERVRDATDRFANAQTNYLLQRLESFDGIAILTTNSRSRLDSAFTRRLDSVVEFAMPGPEQRRALWYAHLGASTALGDDDVNRLAARAALAGGSIRNVVLLAAVFARDDGAPIAWSHVARALGSEYRKLGKQVPAELDVSTAGDAEPRG